MLINTFVLKEINTNIFVNNNIIIAYQIVLDNSKQKILLPGKDNANIIINSIIQEKKKVKLLLVQAKDTYKILVSSY
jgi:hypothetical protein